MFLIIFPRLAVYPTVYPNLLLLSFLNNGIPPVILRFLIRRGSEFHVPSLEEEEL